MNSKKIEESFDQWFKSTDYDFRETTGEDNAFRCYMNGYMALLNELEPFTYYDEIQTYRLPEGVTK